MEQLPVLIYIHGGGYFYGAGDDHQHGPELLLQQCVILVTLNYRLGIFGFASLALPDYSGNMGLKDQRMAIQWVHENIEAFGGDVNKITLFGESAGGASVLFHTLNADSRKNFNQIFAMSSMTIRGDISPASRNHTNRIIDFASQIGQNIRNRTDLIKFLENVSVENILSKMTQWSPSKRTMAFDWVPVIEGI